MDCENFKKLESTMLRVEEEEISFMCSYLSGFAVMAIFSNSIESLMDKLTIGRMNGSGPCAMLLQRYPEKLGNCFKNYTNSSEGTPKSWKKLYQSYSGFKPFFLAVHILKHMNNFSFYSLSLSFAEKRNSMHACMRMYGDIN